MAAMVSIGRGIAFGGLCLAAAISAASGYPDGATLFSLMALGWLVFGNWSDNAEAEAHREHIERLIDELPKAERAAFIRQYLRDDAQAASTQHE